MNHDQHEVSQREYDRQQKQKHHPTDDRHHDMTNAPKATELHSNQSRDSLPEFQI